LSPYVSFGLSMCLIVGLSLAATAYIAVMFNRRAKADLLAALTPLADVVEGEVDAEEAVVTGRYRGHLAEGRVGNAPNGPGRVFFTSVVDGAGGERWSVTGRKPKQPDAGIEFDVEGSLEPPIQHLQSSAKEMLGGFLTERGWLKVEYDPVPGYVRLTRPMATRRDIPSAAAFSGALDAMVELAARNRNVQTDG